MIKDEPIKKPEALSMPEVKETVVKGYGLAAIKQSLRSLIDPTYIPGLDDPIVKINPIDRQKLLEEDAIQSSLERWKKDFESRQEAGVLSTNKSLNALLWEWHSALVPLIHQELGRVYEAEKAPDKLGNADRALYGPFMRLLPPEKIAVIAMLEVLKVCNEGSATNDGAKSSKAVMSVGKMLENEVLAQELQKRYKGKDQKDALNELFSSPQKFSIFIRRERARAAQKTGVDADYFLRPEWPTMVKAKLGAVLISMLIYASRITARKPGDDGEMIEHIQPAFLHSYQYVRGRKLGVIKLNSEVVRMMGTEPLRGSILSRHLPMVVPPRPWMGPKDGGYYYSPVKAVRTKDSREQDMYVKTAASRGDLEQLFAGLDVLGSTSWAINKKVFTTILEVWNTGTQVAEIPSLEVEIDMPPEPEATDDPATRIAWAREMKRIATAKRNHHSQRCDVNFKVEIARAFLGEKIYFPHNVDFRGRAYPIPPHLNHIGNDLCRGLLMFHEGKKLGTSGLRWLKIHLSNVYGFDKANFSEREQFATDHMADIIDSAENPLTV